MELPASLEGSYWLACFGQGSRGGEPSYSGIFECYRPRQRCFFFNKGRPRSRQTLLQLRLISMFTIVIVATRVI